MAVVRREPETFQDPVFIRELFGSTRWAWLWTVVRLWLGWEWLQAGLHKIGSPAWVETGVAVKGFWERAVAVPEGGRPPIAFDWYRSFIQVLLDGDHYRWLAPLIAWGEVLIGLGLLVGALTGFAAFFGALMNFNFMMAGSASTNPLMFTLAVLLLLAWKTAGWYGVDRWLLPAMGTPWEPGKVFSRHEERRKVAG